jgi:membrane-associated phospholipid phosphatase
MSTKIIVFIFADMISDPGSCLLTFWQLIQPVDAWLLTHINQDWSNPFFDTLMPYLRETLFWVPMYFFLLLFVTINFGAKGWWWVAAVILTAALSDIISSQLIKPNIFRLRPCRDSDVVQHLRIFILYCPGSSSFTSSHATSHFAQGLFFYLTLRPVIHKWAYFFLIWAFSIAYTQVYVGVHYPFDVFCGALLGCGIGWLMAKLFNQRIGNLTVS